MSENDRPSDAPEESTPAPELETDDRDDAQPVDTAPATVLTEFDIAEAAAKLAEANDEEVRRQLRRMTRRGFLVAAAAAGTGYAGWRWLMKQPRDGGVQWPFRRALEFNEALSGAYFSTARLSPTFSPSRISPRARINGHLGLTPDYNPESWRLRIEGVAGAAGPVTLAIDQIKALPRREMITELRCIEGWSIVVRWTGARLTDLMRMYPPPTRDGSAPDVDHHPDRLVRYVAMETPGRGYYVGLDMESAIHPQTLLAYEINGQPLDWHHGAPLRLAIPVKYGIKNIKRIATIRYTDLRPSDFWAERGYDWYAGH